MAASPLAYGKGTKRTKQLGEFGLKRSSGAGKGPVIKDSFGDGWLQNTEDRLNAREQKCSACGFSKPSGDCPRTECGYKPEGNMGW